MSNNSIPMNEWVKITNSSVDILEVMYLGCFGLIRNSIYRCNGILESSNIIEIDHQSARVLINDKLHRGKIKN